MLLHRPPCPIMNSDPKVPVDKQWIEKSHNRSVDMAALDEWANWLKTADAPNKFSKSMSDYKVLGNIPMMQCMIEYLVVHLHYYRMGASVIAKDMRVGVDLDVLRKPYTMKIYEEIPSLNVEEPAQEADHNIGDKLRCLLSRMDIMSTVDDDKILRAAELIEKHQAPDLLGKVRKFSDQVRLLESIHESSGLVQEVYDQIKDVLEQWKRERIENAAKTQTAHYGSMEDQYAEGVEDAFAAWGRQNS